MSCNAMVSQHPAVYLNQLAFSVTEVDFAFTETTIYVYVYL
jgi:hypothetical protein